MQHLAPSLLLETGKGGKKACVWIARFGGVADPQQRVRTALAVKLSALRDVRCAPAILIHGLYERQNSSTSISPERLDKRYAVSSPFSSS